MARALVKQNGLEDRVEVIRGDVAQIALPEPVDVIVGEWMGCYGVDENLLSPLLVARDRWLKPGGRLLPETLSAWLAPVEDTRLAEEMDFWHTGAYGVDFSPMAQGFANEVRMGQHHLTAEPRSLPARRSGRRTCEPSPWRKDAPPLPGDTGVRDHAMRPALCAGGLVRGGVSRRQRAHQHAGGRRGRIGAGRSSLSTGAFQ